MSNVERIALAGTATRILRTEHDAVLEVFGVLELASERLATNQPVDLTVLDEMVDFLKVFVDSCHHTKEEEILFPVLEKNGIPRENGPIGCMLTEHEEGRAFIRNMQESLTKLANHDPAGIIQFSQNANAYIELMRSHILKENTVLFRMADFILSPEIQRDLAEQFEDVELHRLGAGTHERLHARIEKWLILAADWKSVATV